MLIASTTATSHCTLLRKTPQHRIFHQHHEGVSWEFSRGRTWLRTMVRVRGLSGSRWRADDDRWGPHWVEGRVRRKPHGRQLLSVVYFEWNTEYIYALTPSTNLTSLVGKRRWRPIVNPALGVLNRKPLHLHGTTTSFIGYFTTFGPIVQCNMLHCNVNVVSSWWVVALTSATCCTAM